MSGTDCASVERIGIAAANTGGSGCHLEPAGRDRSNRPRLRRENEDSQLHPHGAGGELPVSIEDIRGGSNCSKDCNQGGEGSSTTCASGGSSNGSSSECDRSSDISENSEEKSCSGAKAREVSDQPQVTKEEIVSYPTAYIWRLLQGDGLDPVLRVISSCSHKDHESCDQQTQGWCGMVTNCEQGEIHSSSGREASKGGRRQSVGNDCGGGDGCDLRDALSSDHPQTANSERPVADEAAAAETGMGVESAGQCISNSNPVKPARRIRKRLGKNAEANT